MKPGFAGTGGRRATAGGGSWRSSNNAACFGVWQDQARASKHAKRPSPRLLQREANLSQSDQGWRGSLSPSGASRKNFKSPKRCWAWGCCVRGPSSRGSKATPSWEGVSPVPEWSALKPGQPIGFPKKQPRKRRQKASHGL